MADNENYVIRVKRGTANEWAIYNPILGAGELGYDTTNRRLKVGDGLNVWSNIKFATGNSFDVARDAGFDGTLSEWLESLRGEDGVGPTNHITVGNVTTGPEPKVELRGESPNQIIDFTFPAAGEPIEYTKATPAKDGLMPKEDKATLDSATTYGKDFLSSTNDADARDKLFLKSGALASAGNKNDLIVGTATTASTWSPKFLNEFIKDNDTATLDSSKTYTDNAITNMPRDISKGVGAPTIPVVNNGVYIDTATGDQYIGVDKGPDPIINMHTNPSNESPADNTSSGYVDARNDPFKVIQLNLLYQNLNPDEDGIRWEDRKPRIANFINTENPGLMAVEENSSTAAGTSLSEIMELVNSKFKSVEFKGSNNGMLYNSEVFEVEEVVQEIVLLNKVFITGGPQRSMTVVRLRHKNMDQRVIFCVVHFVQDPAFVTGRKESIRLCTEFISDYCKQFSDLPAVIISGDFNAAGKDFTDYFADFGYIPTKIKSSTTAWTDQGSYHGFDINGNTSANWIDDHYTNNMLSVVDTKLGIDSLPMVKTEMLSDHHPVISIVKFKYAKTVQLIGTSGEVTTSSNTYQYFSSRWSRSGGGSLAIASFNEIGSTGACAYIASLGSDTNDRIGWEVGKTYTVSGYIYIPKVMVNAGGWTRSITIGTTHQGESNNYSYAAAVRAPNAVGVHRVSVTFTVPNKDNTFIRVMNGSASDTVYWDDFMITEGETLHEYFDGDYPGCYWEGAAHFSRSIYPGPSWVKVN